MVEKEEMVEDKDLLLIEFSDPAISLSAQTVCVLD